MEIRNWDDAKANEEFMLRLKQMSWNDEWGNYIEYRRTDVSEDEKWYNFAAEPFYKIRFIMMQLEDKMPVYEAFLKGLEIYYSSETCGKVPFLQKYRRLQKKIYKNMKNGIIDEFLIDVHHVMIKAGMKWCSDKQDL